MIDPFLLKNPKTPTALKDLKKLGKVDLILVIHGHFDHTADVQELAKMTGAIYTEKFTVSYIQHLLEPAGRVSTL